MKAIRCEDDQVLSAGNFQGMELSLNEQTGKRKITEKIAQDVIKDFPFKIVEIWATDVATGRIALKPISGSPSPQIKISSPADGEVSAEPTARLVLLSLT